MNIQVKTLIGKWATFDLLEVGEVYEDDDVIYFDGTPCVLSTACPFDAKAAEIAKLELDLLQAGRLENELNAIITDKDAEIERIGLALEFYANQNNWEPRVATESDAVLDGGEIARAAREKREVEG